VFYPPPCFSSENTPTTHGLRTGNSMRVSHSALLDTTVIATSDFFITSSVDAAPVGHRFAVGDEVTVEGRIWERAPRAMAFPAFVEELLPGGGYYVRRVLSNKSRRSWVKIEDGSRVQAPTIRLSTRESIEERRHQKHLQLAAAEARAEAEKHRTHERDEQHQRETENREGCKRKGKLSKATAAEKSSRHPPENRGVADAARMHPTFAALVDVAVAAKTAHLQVDVEAPSRC
jgi:hypothetical protein